MKSGKTMNFLENHCQKHILSPVQHDQHPETHSLDPWLTFNSTQNWGLSGDDIGLPQSPPGLIVAFCKNATIKKY